MNQTGIQNCHEQELQFFGAISASLSHQLNNVLSIINENAGLLSDMLAAAEQGFPLDAAKIDRSTQRIAKQVNRGAGYISRMNQFAHSVDETEQTVDLNVMLAQIVSLCQRFASLRKVALLIEEPAPAEAKIQACSFRLQHLVYLCIDLALAGSDQESTIQLSLAVTENRHRLSLHWPGSATAKTGINEKVTVARQMAQQSGGEFEATVEAGKAMSLTLTF